MDEKDVERAYLGPLGSPDRMSGSGSTGGEVGEHKTFARERVDFILSAAISLHNLNEGHVVEGCCLAGGRQGLSEWGVILRKQGLELERNDNVR